VGEGTLGLVDGAQEAGSGAVGRLDDPGFAVYEHPVLRHDPHFETAPGQEIKEPAVALAVQQSLDFGGRLVPAPQQSHFASMPRDEQVVRVQLAVADHLDALDTGDFFTHQLEDELRK
jgi:hypothetical protein